MWQRVRASSAPVMVGRWRDVALSYAVALAAVTVVSLFIGLVLGHISIANISMLYLLAVLTTAVAFGRGRWVRIVHPTHPAGARGTC